jgi:hypothetical protein
LNFRQNRALFAFDAAFAGIGTALPGHRAAPHIRLAGATGGGVGFGTPVKGVTGRFHGLPEMWHLEPCGEPAMPELRIGSGGALRQLRRPGRAFEPILRQLRCSIRA